MLFFKIGLKIMMVTAHEIKTEDADEDFSKDKEMLDFRNCPAE